MITVPDISEFKGGLTIVCGGNGVGKSAFLARFGVGVMGNAKATRHDLERCNSVLRDYNRGEFNFSLQQEHLFYSTLDISYRDKRNREIPDLSRIGLRCAANPNPFGFPPCSTIVIDECQRLFNSRGRLPNHLSLWFEIRRHNGYTVLLASQREQLIDLNVRGLAGQIIEIDRMDHEYDMFGRILRTKWTCYAFEHCYAVDKYLANAKDKTIAEKREFVFEGNIFKHYDSSSCEAAFFDLDKSYDFDVSYSPVLERSFDTSKDFAVRKFGLKDTATKKSAKKTS